MKNISKAVDAVKTVSDRTGESYFVAVRRIERARQAGIGIDAYLKNRLYRFPEDSCELSEADRGAVSRYASESNLSYGGSLARLIPKKASFGGTYDELVDRELERRKRRLRSKRRVSLVAQKAGWEDEYAKARMDEAKKEGISYFYYLTCRGWECENLSDLADRVEKEREKRDRRERQRACRVDDVCRQTGWSEACARDRMDRAEDIGVSYYYYAKCHAWDLDDTELKDLAGICEKKRIVRKKDKIFYAHVVSERSGMPLDDVLVDMGRWKAHGISPMRYAQKDLWALSDEDAKYAVENIEERKAMSGQNATDFLPKIAKQTGWSTGRALMEIERARVEMGASAADFYQYKMWELPSEVKRTLITWGLMQKLRIQSNDYRLARSVFDDKVQFNKTFGDVVRRRWFMFDAQMSFESFCKEAEGLDGLFCKPIAATMGKGIIKVDCCDNAEDWRRLYGQLKMRGTQIIEEPIAQHEETAAFCPASVNTVRVVTLFARGRCNILSAVIRMGTGAAVDNFHAGGLAAEVDPDTGVVITDAIDYRRHQHACHPISGKKILGFQVPHWDLVKSICESIADRVPGISYVGWDFAITPDGVDVVEGNGGAAYDVVQMPHFLTFGVGLRERVVDPYLRAYD